MVRGGMTSPQVHGDCTEKSSMRYEPEQPALAIPYTVLRVVTGLLFLCHGLQKLFGWFGGHRVALDSQLGLAGMIETTAGVLIAVGLFTAVVAAVAALEMVAAFIVAHAPRGGLPIQNGGELALLYCAIFIYMAVRGDGRFSIGALIPRSSRPLVAS
jgi:putative oxidoreductase